MKPNLLLSEQIPGWMTHEELTWLAKEASRHQLIVEIGCYLGRTTRAMADNTDGIVYAVDDFKGPRDISLPTSLRENNLETFMWQLRDHLQAGKVVMIVADHDDIPLQVIPDMVFIDGSHEYEDVKRDILTWANRLSPNGLICGHDYTNMATVKAAVEETLENHKVARGTSIWYAQN